jgi:hypothetical protein
MVEQVFKIELKNGKDPVPASIESVHVKQVKSQH